MDEVGGEIAEPRGARERGDFGGGECGDVAAVGDEQTRVEGDAGVVERLEAAAFVGELDGRLGEVEGDVGGAVLPDRAERADDAVDGAVTDETEGDVFLGENARALSGGEHAGALGRPRGVFAAHKRFGECDAEVDFLSGLFDADQ